MIRQAHFWTYTWTKLLISFKKIFHPYVHSNTIHNSQDVCVCVSCAVVSYSLQPHGL